MRLRSEVTVVPLHMAEKFKGDVYTCTCSYSLCDCFEVQMILCKMIFLAATLGPYSFCQFHQVGMQQP